MNKKINVYLMYIITFLQGLIFYVPVSTIYRQSRGLSMYQIFLLESIFTVILILSQVPLGWVADKYGYKFTLIISNILYFVSKIVFYKANSFQLFLLEDILIALAISALSGCDIALLYSSIDKNKSEKVFGIYSALNASGLLVAAISYSFLVLKSMDFAVFCTIIPYGIAAVLTFFIEEEPHAVEKRPSLKSSFKEILNNKSIIIIVVAVALTSEITHSVCVFLNQPQYIRSGISLKYFGIIAAVMQAFCLLSAKAYKFTERFGQKRTMLVLLFNILISCIVLKFTDNPFLSIVMIAIMEGSYAIVQPIILAIENKTASSDNRATILSMYAMMGDAISTILNIIIGKAADVSVSSAFGTCSVLSIIVCLLAFVYFKIVKINVKARR